MRASFPALILLALGACGGSTPEPGRLPPMGRRTMPLVIVGTSFGMTSDEVRASREPAGLAPCRHCVAAAAVAREGCLSTGTTLVRFCGGRACRIAVRIIPANDVILAVGELSREGLARRRKVAVELASGLERLYGPPQIAEGERAEEVLDACVRGEPASAHREWRVPHAEGDRVGRVTYDFDCKREGEVLRLPLSVTYDADEGAAMRLREHRDDACVE